MPATGWPRPSLLELGWAALVVACLVLMILSPPWETIPFHVIWISLTLFYGFRVWRTSTTAGVLVAIAIGSGATDPSRHVRRQAAVGRVVRGSAALGDVPRDGVACAPPRTGTGDRQGACRRTRLAPRTGGASASRRLPRTPDAGDDRAWSPRAPATTPRQRNAPELDVAFDELARMERIVERVLLARSG